MFYLRAFSYIWQMAFWFATSTKARTGYEPRNGWRYSLPIDELDAIAVCAMLELFEDNFFRRLNA